MWIASSWCMQIVLNMQHYISAWHVWLLYNCSNYVSSQEHIESLHLFTPRTGMCSPHYAQAPLKLKYHVKMQGHLYMRQLISINRKLILSTYHQFHTLNYYQSELRAQYLNCNLCHQYLYNHQSDQSSSTHKTCTLYVITETWHIKSSWWCMTLHYLTQHTENIWSSNCLGQGRGDSALKIENKLSVSETDDDDDDDDDKLVSKPAATRLCLHWKKREGETSWFDMYQCN